MFHKHFKIARGYCKHCSPHWEAAINTQGILKYVKTRAHFTFQFTIMHTLCTDYTFYNIKYL